MKIDIITSPFSALPPDAIGAIERRWFDVANVFSEKGHDVQIIGKKDKTALPDKAHIHLTYVPGFSRTVSIYLDIALDFIYSVRTLRRLDKCAVLIANTFWVPILAPLLARRKYGKLVYNVARFPKRHLMLYRRVDMFVCTSSAVKRALFDVMPGIPEEKVSVVNNPIDVASFRPSGNVGQNSIPLIGYHGRINREKGLDILASAVAVCARRVPDIRLRIIGAWDVGRGGSGKEYKKELDRLSGGRIEWVAPLSSRSELASRLRDCEIYCYPSVAEKGETFGVSPLEAMGLGLPVVVSGLECFGDYVVDGENGIVFDHKAKDPAFALAEKIMLLHCDIGLRRRIGVNAAARAAMFSNDRIADRYIEVFEKL